MMGVGGAGGGAGGDDSSDGASGNALLFVICMDTCPATCLWFALIPLLPHPLPACLLAFIRHV